MMKVIGPFSSTLNRNFSSPGSRNVPSLSNTESVRCLIPTIPHSMLKPLISSQIHSCQSKPTKDPFTLEMLFGRTMQKLVPFSFLAPHCVNAQERALGTTVFSMVFVVFRACSVQKSSCAGGNAMRTRRNVKHTGQASSIDKEHRSVSQAHPPGFSAKTCVL